MLPTNYFRQPVSHDFAEAAEAMFRSRHPEVAPAQSNKAAGGNTNKGRMHTGGRERQPESGRRQPEYAKAGRADSPNSKTCSFHASTLVKTQTGYKAIADIKAGDKVLSKNEHNGETGYKTVTAQYSNPYAETVYVHIADAADQNQTLIANKIHPFYTNGRWIEAGSLKAGDILETANGEKQTVQSVVIKAEPLKAYNLTVQDFHTYFVKGKGAETNAVWVHNACPTEGNLTGEPTKISDKEAPENKRALQRENESAQILAKNGYHVEQNPKSNSNKNPDYKINGEIFDNLAPQSNSVRNIASRIAEKVSSKQTERVVVNLADSTVTPDALKQQLLDWKIYGLKTVIIIDKTGTVFPPIHF